MVISCKHPLNLVSRTHKRGGVCAAQELDNVGSNAAIELATLPVHTPARELQPVGCGARDLSRRRALLVCLGLGRCRRPRRGWKRRTSRRRRRKSRSAEARRALGAPLVAQFAHAHVGERQVQRAPRERAGQHKAVREEHGREQHQRVAQRADRAVVRVEQTEAQQQRQRAASREHQEPQSTLNKRNRYFIYTQLGSLHSIGMAIKRISIY